MNNFGTLYKYELKKIVKKKFVIISLLMIYAFLILVSSMRFFEYKYIGNKKYMSSMEILYRGIQNEKALSGIPVDDALIKKTQDTYIKYKDFKDSFGDDTSDDQKWKIEDFYWNTFKPYDPVYSFCITALNMSDSEYIAWDAGEDNLYSGIGERIKKLFDSFRLTDREISFWKSKNEEITTPLTFYYYGGYRTILGSVYFMSVILMMFTAVSLSGVFADEKASHCDDLIQSSRNGKKTIYYAKLAAGLTFTEGSSIILLFAYVCSVFAIYGTDGFSAPLQLFRQFYPYPVSIGSFMIIIYAILLIILMLISLIVMFISINTDRNIIPLGIMLARVIVGMFIQIPADIRIASQIWTLLPVNYLYASYRYDMRLIPLFGHYLVSWQAVPVIYIALSAVFFLTGKMLYTKCQNM